MTGQHLVTAEDFCIYHQVEVTFLQDLHNEGLIVLNVVNDKLCIIEEQLVKVEKMVNLYRDLEVNLPGLASIEHLLSRIDSLQQELSDAKNRLRFYDDQAAS